MSFINDLVIILYLWTEGGFGSSPGIGVTRMLLWMCEKIGLKTCSTHVHVWVMPRLNLRHHESEGHFVCPNVEVEHDIS